MTTFEDWILKTAKALVGTMREDNEPDWGDIAVTSEEGRQRCIKHFEESWDLLERRLAIGLVQARALECRQISASMLIHRPPTLKELANGLTDRSTRLERLGIQMAEPDGWPPSNEPKEDATVEPGPRMIIQ